MNLGIALGVGFNQIVNTGKSYLLNIITSLGYTPDVAVSVRQVNSNQNYSGLINVVDTGIDYKIAWDNNGLLSASSELYNTSDLLQGTVQSIIIDNSYTADWKEFYNQVSSGSVYDFKKEIQSERPSFAISGALRTYNGTNAALFFDGSADHFVQSSHTNNTQPRTIIGVVSDWTSTFRSTFVGSSDAGGLQIRKDQGSNKIDLVEINVDFVANSTGDVAATGIQQFAVGVYENNVGSGDDVRFWINGGFDSDKSDGGAVTFSGDDTRLGLSRSVDNMRFDGYIMEYITIPNLLSNSDIQTIYDNQMEGF